MTMNSAIPASRKESTIRSKASGAAHGFMRQKERARYSDQSRVVRSLKRQGQLRAGLSARKASDIIWALATERSYLALVRDRGWRTEEYEDWLTEQLAAALLPP